jgi:hypothetical protein
MLNPEGDIEDIYREFAENYPLKTDDNGWDDFMHKMQQAPVQKLPSPKGGNGSSIAEFIKKYRYWLSAAATVVVIASVMVINSKKDKAGPPAAPGAQVVNNIVPQPQPGKEPVKEGQKLQQVVDDNSPADKKTGEAVVPVPQPAQKTADATTAGSPRQSEGLPKQPSAGEKALPKTQDVQSTVDNKVNKVIEGKEAGGQPSTDIQSPAAEKDIKKTVAKNGKQADKESAVFKARTPKITSEKTLSPVAGSTEVSTKSAGDKAANDDSKGSVVKGAAQTAGDKQQAVIGDSRKSVMQDTALNATQTDTALADNKPKEVIVPTIKDTAAVITADAAEKAAGSPNTAIQPMVKVSTQAQKYFYFGLAAGPDYSTVKFQAIKHTGFSIGAVFGVYMGHGISVESGLLYTAKKYYSSGSHFKPIYIGPVDRPDFKSVNTDGSFVEIPLLLRVNLANRKRYNFFVSGGLSSYFTTKEKNEITFHRQSGEEIRHRDSDEPCNNIFSIFHLSAGYELKLNAKNAFRFEPYLKLPLSGIGEGGLPVTSSGIYINFTHSFFK